MLDKFRKGLWVVGAIFLFLAALASDFTTGLNGTIITPAVLTILGIGFIIYSFGGT